MKTNRKSSVRTFRFNTLSDLELHGITAESVIFRGRRAVRLIEKEGSEDDDAPAIAIIPDSQFHDGVIQVMVAGLTRANADEGARGFIGIAFRVSPRGDQFECFYLRPTNGRADDQLRRNHATQYISHPDFPWFKLRSENPGVYESYTDLIPGAWTKMSIEVSGTRARLFVNDAPQPCLIVNDLKLGETRGQVALWIGGGTEAYFSNLTLR